MTSRGKLKERTQQAIRAAATEVDHYRQRCYELQQQLIKMAAENAKLRQEIKGLYHGTRNKTSTD